MSSGLILRPELGWSPKSQAQTLKSDLASESRYTQLRGIGDAVK